MGGRYGGRGLFEGSVEAGFPQGGGAGSLERGVGGQVAPGSVREA